MFRRGFTLSFLAPALVFFASVSADIVVSLKEKPSLITTAPFRTEFPKPGPRRYPPGYQPAQSALLPH
jgi:hypothetical protein